jgi:hypothetical protein
MPTVYPFAVFDPLGTQTERKMKRHDIVCLHTMAASFDGVDRGFHENGYGGLESHFGVAGDGRLKQWQDLDFEADANFDGNHRCISIETADRGETFPKWTGSDVPAWTDEQIDVIVPLVRWLCETFDIPKVLVADSKPGVRGIAYHRLGVPHSTGKADAPGGPWHGEGCELWTHPKKGRGKVCPGDRRIAQIKEIVVPRVQAAEGEDDMPLTKDDLGKIQEVVRATLNEGTAQGQPTWARTSSSTLASVQVLVNEVKALNGQVKELKQRVAKLEA